MVRFAIVLAIPLFAFTARARDLGVSVEPYLGYSQFNFSSEGVSDQELGAVLGGKGGITLGERAYAALDFHLGGPYLLENNADNEYLNRMWGAGGAYLGRRFRLWLGYYFDAALDDVNRGFVFRGTGWKASLGFSFRSKLSLNLEYSRQTYTEARGVSAPASPDLEVEVLFLSVSAPIRLSR